MRNLVTGYRIPSIEGGYADQPYVVINGDGSWTCVMTTGSGHEGQSGQHIIATVSEDQGRTWYDPVAIEPPDGPEASWAQPLRVPETGRIYVFYTYNRHNQRKVQAEDGRMFQRVDSFGTYAYRYSDDRGFTWSSQRYEIPMRLFECDRNNTYGGDVLFFWGVGHPFVKDGMAMVPSCKVGGFGPGFFSRNEGVLFCSPNLLTDHDPNKHEWETRPEGEIGVRTPPGGGPIAGEFNAIPMNDGSLYATFRTIDGYACHAYSRDNGKSWQQDWMRYRPGGRAVKNSRAANFAWRCSNGHYVYWFVNHGGEPLARFTRENPALGYAHRNPAWMCGGVEKNGQIHWSEPEIILYHDDIGVRFSYPDFIEQDGRFFVTETQKSVARAHELDPSLLEAMWRQGENRTVAEDALVEHVGAGDVALPELPTLHNREDGPLGMQIVDPAMGEAPTVAPRGGLTLEFWLRFQELTPWQMVFDSRDQEGRGMTVMLTDRGTLRLNICGRHYARPGGTWSAGLCETAWDTDPGLLEAGKLHHAVFIVDGGPKIITTVVDGQLCDGGDVRQYGWGRFHPALKDANGAETARLGPRMQGEVKRFRLYGRYLRTNDAVAHYLAGSDRDAIASQSVGVK